MNQSDDIADLAAALSKAQGQVEGAKKESDNPAFKRDGKAMRYADLASTWDACREALSSNGLAVLQSPGLTHDGVMHMTTQLTHSSGQWIRGELSLPLSKIDAQGYGSAVTYARRYALAAFIGVAPEDDDGNAAARPSGSAVNNNRAAPDQPQQRPAPLRGPIKTRAAVRNAYDLLVREIHGSGDEDMLDIVLSDQKALIDQIEDEAPFLRDGDGMDFLGMRREIKQRRDELRRDAQTMLSAG